MYKILFCLLCIYCSCIRAQQGISDPSSASIYPTSFHSLNRPLDSYNYVVVYVGYCYSSSGYGQEGRTYIKGLLALGVPIFLHPLEQLDKIPSLSTAENALFKSLEIRDLPSFVRDKKNQNKLVIAVHHVTPDSFKSEPWADYNIIRTMWEMNDFPSKWVPELMKADEIWIPSEFNKHTFSAGGLPEEKNWVIGECMDEDYYGLEVTKKARLLNISGKRNVNFLSVFNWNYRKGWDVLVEAFAKEFLPESGVVLFIKTFSSWGRKVDEFQADILKVLQAKEVANTFPSNIILLTSGFSENEMAGLYKSFDAFVLPTRAEGWGRTTMEAMASGVPVVTTKYSGQEEFITSKNAFVIKHQLVPVPSEAAEEVPLFEGGKWAEPSVSDLRKILRHISKSQKDATKKAKAGQSFVLENFMCGKITAQMRDRFDEIVSKHKQT